MTDQIVPTSSMTIMLRTNVAIMMCMTVVLLVVMAWRLGGGIVVVAAGTMISAMVSTIIVFSFTECRLKTPCVATFVFCGSLNSLLFSSP